MMTTGNIHLFGSHIDTDVILPGKYLNLHQAKDLAPHCMEGIDPTFVERVRTGDVIVAGNNFGTGSSREHAPIAIQAVGIRCIIATSYARIFYRNAINIGLPVFECPELIAAVREGDQISSDIETGVFVVNGVHYQAKPFPTYIQGIIKQGGLVPFIKNQLNK